MSSRHPALGVTRNTPVDQVRAYLAAIVSSSDDAIIGKTLDGTITSWNNGAERLYGFTAAEAIGRSISIIIPPDRPNEMIEILASIRRGERVDHYETVRIRKDDQRINVSITVSPIVDARRRTVGASSIGRDITERIRAEEDRRRYQRELQEERDHLQQILNVLPEGVAVADTTGQLVLANAACYRIMGQDVRGEPVSLTGEAPLGSGRIDSTPNLAPGPPLQRSLRTGEVVHGERLIVHNTKTDRDVPLLVNSAPIRDASGRVIEAVVVYQDITALQELERLRDEWTSMIAHDLRQPVTIIRGYAELALRALEQRTELGRETQLLKHVHTAAINLNKMIADLLDVSRIEARRLTIERQVVDLLVLVRDAVERTATVTQGHPVRVDATGDVPLVQVDPVRIEQVLGNLLTNAAKYSYRDSEISLVVEPKDGEVEVSVTNRGEGISADELPKLFSRFYRARPGREGAVAGIGLGLYISRSLVEAHGGRIWVESVPNQITTFHFTVPAEAGGEVARVANR